MHEPNPSGGQRGGLSTPTRNRYFYGQLLGVHNFELETEYSIRQRRLLNRLVFGYGVVCGLNVELTRDGTAVVVGPGMAINRRGEEITVAQRTQPIPIPSEVLQTAVERARDRKTDPCVQVLICYHECQGDPAPVLAGDCTIADPCTPSIIREQYRIEFRDECTDKPEPRCHIPDLISDDRIDHDELAKWVTRERNCTRLPGDPCIPLANLPVVDPDKPHCDPGGVDIGVRPVLASNLVLLELILALLEDLRADRESRYE
jgi:hypothetical protein